MQIYGQVKNQICQPAMRRWSLLNASHQQLIVILDGAPVVNFLKPTGVAKFEDYANQVFKLYIERQLKDFIIIDIVWDKYIPNILKAST